MIYQVTFQEFGQVSYLIEAKSREEALKKAEEAQHERYMNDTRQGGAGWDTYELIGVYPMPDNPDQIKKVASRYTMTLEPSRNAPNREVIVQEGDHGGLRIQVGTGEDMVIIRLDIRAFRDTLDIRVLSFDAETIALVSIPRAT